MLKISQRFKEKCYGNDEKSLINVVEGRKRGRLEGEWKNK
jgi:hypothetical protein